MANVNKVLLLGRLVKDPELRYTPGGAAVCDLRMATSRKYKTKDGEQREESCFVGVVVWGRPAELCKEYLAKGREVFVEGRLTLDEWNDKQTGEKRSKLYVTAEPFGVQFLSRGGDRAPTKEVEAEAQAAPSEEAAAAAQEPEEAPF